MSREDGKQWEVLYFDCDMSTNVRFCEQLRQRNGMIVKIRQEQTNHSRHWAHYVQYGNGNQALSHYYEHIIDTFLHYTSAP